MERTSEGVTTQTVKLIGQMNALVGDLPAPLQREVAMVVHKMSYPMREILSKVPGASLTERAKKLKVSRQTIYVWLSEKFRPTKAQAKRIAKVTGVPIEQVMDNEAKNDTGGKTRKTAARVATRRKKPSSAKGRAKPPRRRSVSDKHRIADA